jgi:hypothetical protein
VRHLLFKEGGPYQELALFEEVCNARKERIALEEWERPVKYTLGYGVKLRQHPKYILPKTLQ